MKHKLILTLLFIAFIINDILAQPPMLPGDDDGGNNVTDDVPIHFLIPIAMAVGAYIGIKKLKKDA